MNQKNKTEKAQEIILEFFEKMTLPVVLENKAKDSNILKMEAHSQEAQALIGYQGKNLADIQSVLGKIIRKKIGEDFFIDIDVNGYKNEKEQKFRDIAQEAANEATRTGRAKILFPMNSFERR